MATLANGFRLFRQPVGNQHVGKQVGIVTPASADSTAVTRVCAGQTFPTEIRWILLRNRGGRYECAAFQITEMNRRSKKAYS